MLKLVLEPTWMPKHISNKLIFITKKKKWCQGPGKYNKKKKRGTWQTV